ncbi:helix-turn-helix domain-containing protein [Spirosoma litoris]
MILCPVIGIRDKEAIKLFGINIRQKRLDKGFSQEELAYQCHIDTRQIGRIERGEINTTISTVFALARALELTVADLFDFPLPSIKEGESY